MLLKGVGQNMNKLFQFHKELNIKKIILIVLIILLLIFLIFFVQQILKNLEKSKIENSEPNKTFTSNDKRFSLILSKEYGFSKYQPTQNYILELRTPTNIDIFVSHKDLAQNADLNAIVSNDRNSYIDKFNGYSNLSDIAQLTINGKPAYSYSFHYPDNKTAYYLQVIWIQTETGYYVVDVEFPLEMLNTTHKLITDLTAGAIKFNDDITIVN